MERAGLLKFAWILAKEGLTYIGDRRDIIWASLEELDTYSAHAEQETLTFLPDSPRVREYRKILKNYPLVEVKARKFYNYPFDSRQEILQSPAIDEVALIFLAGDCR